MSNKTRDGNTHVIHERALKVLGLEMVLVILGVARDLRNGVIEEFDMKYFYKEQKDWSPHRPTEMWRSATECGTPLCIWGHTASRLGMSAQHGRNVFDGLRDKDCSLGYLFAASNPSDPMMAARAIERYVLEGSDDPWILGLRYGWDTLAREVVLR